MMNIRINAHDARLLREPPNDMLRRSPSVDLLLKVGQRLDEEQRGHVHTVELSQPHGLIWAQGLKKRLVEDQNRTRCHVRPLRSLHCSSQVDVRCDRQKTCVRNGPTLGWGMMQGEPCDTIGLGTSPISPSTGC